MKAILRTNDYNQNYEIVDIIKNPISDNNGLAHIIDSSGEEKWTGGILIEVDQRTMTVLDNLTNKEQYDWLHGLTTNIYIK